MRRPIVALAVLAGLSVSAPVMAQSCADLGPIGTLVERMTGDGDPALAEAFCADYGAMAERVAAAETAAAELADRVTSLEAALPPAEAILLIDRAQGCPAGWTDLALAEPSVFAGRVPVATGFVEGLTFRGFREVGGSETHQLTEAELPAHAHGIPLTFQRLAGDDRGGSSSLSTRLTTGQQVAVSTRTGRESTARVGSGQPHPTMPPFVALFFCKRG